MPADKFSYYVDDNNTPKVMDHFQALQLDRSFFDNVNEVALAGKARNLYLEFHPDKNLDATEVLL